jgi:hypothetical protein
MGEIEKILNLGSWLSFFPVSFRSLSNHVDLICSVQKLSRLPEQNDSKQCQNDCHFESFKQKISLQHHLNHKNIIKALFNTLKNLILVLFHTKKYIKSCKFLQVIVFKVTTALKEMIQRNIILDQEISFKHCSSQI